MNIKHITNTILVLFLATLPVMGQDMPPVRNDLLKYYLHTPKGLNTWILDS